MSIQLPVDRGYLNLLAHLRETKLQIPLETLQAAICHYLVHLPSTQPTPTPLTASIIASPVWHPPSLKNYLALGDTFRVAVRENLAKLNKRKRGLFDTSVSSDLTSWTHGILDGLKDGDKLLRLAISGGLHLGMDNLQDFKTSHRLLQSIEETMVLAFAEATDEVSASANDQWATEFKKSDGKAEERVELAILLASHHFNSISTEALAALNLFSLASSCLMVIEKAFSLGKYLHGARDSLVRGTDGSIALSRQPILERSLDGLLSSESFTSMAYLCRLVARITSIMADTSFWSSKRRELWDLLNNIARRVYNFSAQVEEDWRCSPLVDVQTDARFDERTKNVTEKVWTVLKTQLFSSLMLQQAILDTILFVPPPYQAQSSSVYSATHLTSTILKALCSLSFVIASFGGVTAGPAEAGKGPSFPELKKVFYMSIDILSTDVSASDSFIRRLIQDANALYDARSGSPSSSFINAKRSFVLSCIEQFISVLDDSSIERVVLPFCEPHLNDPSGRQTYETAHSVMLSIFASSAEKSTSTSRRKEDRKGKSIEKARPGDVGLARRLVPGYAQILIENAKEGGLTTAQLRLAYAALVRSANTGKNPYHSPSAKPSPSMDSLLHRLKNSREADEGFLGDPALAWLCIEELLQAIASADTDSQTHVALSLTLISCIPNVGLYLLPRILSEVERLVDGETNNDRKRVLIENVFEEILERVGDAEKEAAMKWWFERARNWEGCFESHTRTEQHELESKL